MTRRQSPGPVLALLAAAIIFVGCATVTPTAAASPEAEPPTGAIVASTVAAWGGLALIGAVLAFVKP